MLYEGHTYSSLYLTRHLICTTTAQKWSQSEKSMFLFNKRILKNKPKPNKKSKEHTLGKYITFSCVSSSKHSQNDCTGITVILLEMPTDTGSYDIFLTICYVQPERPSGLWLTEQKRKTECLPGLCLVWLSLNVF